MSMEQVIRNIHSFRAQINDYIKKASPLNRNEIEILMARLSDLMETGPTTESILDKKFKGLLAKPIYDARLSGREPSFGQRFVFRADTTPDSRISFLAKYRFTYPFPLREENIVEWANATPDSWRHLLTSEQQ